jgi:hypothetical protein
MGAPFAFVFSSEFSFVMCFKEAVSFGPVKDLARLENMALRSSLIGFDRRIGGGVLEFRTIVTGQLRM